MNQTLLDTIGKRMFPSRWPSWRAILPTPNALDQALSTREAEYVAQLRSRGYARINRYFDPATCEALASAFDGWLATYADKVETKADQRLFGVEQLDPTIKAFAEDKSILRIASAFAGEPQRTAFTMGNKLMADPSATKERASGGEWHRDGMRLQMKAMAYLVDVGEENGPFTILRNSKRLLNFLGDLSLNRPDEGVRLCHDIARKRAIGFDRRVTKVTANAGDVILFDASAMHRRWPIETGRRYALTNYIRHLAFDAQSKRGRKKFPNLLSPDEIVPNS